MIFLYFLLFSIDKRRFFCYTSDIQKLRNHTVDRESSMNRFGNFLMKLGVNQHAVPVVAAAIFAVALGVLGLATGILSVR